MIPLEHNEIVYSTFEFYGALAQLVERAHGMGKVRSSILLGSTTGCFSCKKIASLYNFLCLCGALAQLVERLVCTEEVRSSNLLGSTKRGPREMPTSHEHSE